MGKKKNMKRSKNKKRRTESSSTTTGGEKSTRRGFDIMASCYKYQAIGICVRDHNGIVDLVPSRFYPSPCKEEWESDDWWKESMESRSVSGGSSRSDTSGSSLRDKTTVVNSWAEWIDLP